MPHVKMMPSALMDRLQALGLNGSAVLNRQSSRVEGESRLSSPRTMGSRNNGMIRVQINSVESLSNKMIAIVRRFRRQSSTRPAGSVEMRMLLHVTRALNDDLHFKTDGVFLSYVEDVELSNIFVLEITERATGHVKVSLAVHL
jgi:hypothetical protein